MLSLPDADTDPITIWFKTNQPDVLNWARTRLTRLRSRERLAIQHAALRGFTAVGDHPFLYLASKAALNQVLVYHYKGQSARAALPHLQYLFRQHRPLNCTVEGCEQEVLRLMQGDHRQYSDKMELEAVRLHFAVHEIAYQSLHCLVHRPAVQ